MILWQWGSTLQAIYSIYAQMTYFFPLSFSFFLSLFSPVSLNLSGLFGLLKIWILDVDKRYQCLSTYESLRENNTWQWGHVIVTGLYPKLGAATYWTLNETVLKKNFRRRAFIVLGPTRASAFTWVTTWTGAWGCWGTKLIIEVFLLHRNKYFETDK